MTPERGCRVHTCGQNQHCPIGQQCTTVVGGITPFLDERAAPIFWKRLLLPDSWQNNPLTSKTIMEKTFEEKINGYYFQFWLWSVIAVSLLIIVIGIIPAFVAMVFECFLLYHAWKAIPNNPWKVPPILAVILLFVPVAGTIWMFWAYYFMSQEMNRELTQKGDSYRTNGEVIMGTSKNSLNFW